MGNPIWSSIGPAPQHEDSVAYSGRAIAFAVSPNFDGAGTRAMFVATDGGGVWRTTQFTGPAPLWQPLSDLVPTPVESRIDLSGISCVTVDPHDSRVIYAGSGSGILLSQDGGNTWILIPNSPNSATKIVVDPRIGGTAIWACGGFGLSVSANGSNWTPVIIGGFGFTSFSVDDLEWTLSVNQKALTLLAAVHDTAQNNDGTRNGIYVTTNEGGTWDKMAIDPVNHEDGQHVFPMDFGPITLGADHTPGSIVPPVCFISKKNIDWRHAILLNIFKFIQGTWTPIGAGLPTGLDSQGGANQPILTTPAGAIYFAVSGNYSPAFFESLDGGSHWADISSANGVAPHHDHHGLLFTDGAVYDANDGGIWRFIPQPQNKTGGTWEYLNTNGLQTIEVEGLSLHPKDPTIVLVGSQDNGTALRVTGVWNSVQDGDTGRVRFDPASSRAYSVTYGRFDRSDDSGMNWKAINLPTGEFPDGMQNYEVDPFGTGRVLIAGSYGTWLSKDNGENWTMIAPTLTGKKDAITAMAFSKDSDKIYVAFDDGQIFRTTNEGRNGIATDWTDVSGANAWGGKIIALATDPASADALYLITDRSGVWRTKDAGASWQNLTSDLPPIGLFALVLVARPNDPYVIVGTSSGVYGCAAPSAPHWRRLGIGFPYVKVADLAYHTASDIMAAGTFGRGVFATAVGDITPPSVTISWPNVDPFDDCPVEPTEGQILKVSCEVGGTTNLSAYRFEWNIEGALFASGATGKAPSIKIILPSPPAPVNISVSVRDDDGYVGTATRVLTPIPFWQAGVERFVCRLRHLYLKLPQFPYYFRPGDPAPHSIVHASAERDLQRVLSISEEMLQAAHSALTLMEVARNSVVLDQLPEHLRTTGIAEEEDSR